VAAPSANRFGCLSPTTAEHVAEQLGDKVDIILDGGRSSVGVESTVLDMSQQGVLCMPRILRPGGTSRQQIEALIGPVDISDTTNSNTVAASASPGQLKSHYAPGVPLTVHRREEMIAIDYETARGYLFFDGISRDAWLAQYQKSARYQIYPLIRTLSEKGDTVEAAANLFAILHEMEKLGLSCIRAELAPAGGLGDAINNRLSRAAAK
jgi:L-threonylcarbamoyladenylate synthase